MSVSNALIGFGIATLATATGIVASVPDGIDTYSGIVKAVSSLGATGVLAWLVWYLIAKQEPRKTAEHEERLDKQAAGFAAALDKVVADHARERDALREERTKAIDAIKENTQATHQLATAVEHLRGRERVN